MNLIQKIGARLFNIGYDAVADQRGRRKGVNPSTRSEDFELRQNQRRILIATSRDLCRNFAIAMWAIRKHLDYVSSFTFRSRTGIETLDAQIEAIFAEWSKAENCDAGGRHSLPRLIRLAEALRTVDGDVLIVMRKDGKLQLVEGDRILTSAGLPSNVDSLEVINGVWLDPDGAAKAYAVYNRVRDGGGLVFDRMVKASFGILHGYFEFRYDQCRGISPMASGVNTLRDVYEGFDYALAKAKVAQMFGLKVTMGTGAPIGDVEKTTGVNADGTPENRYDVNLGGIGPFKIELDPGDDAEFMESSTPSTEFQQFTQAMIMVALKSLDIPFSYYDEAHTNWVGQRQASVQYELSADVKRGDNITVLNRVARWRLILAVIDGEIKLPAGTTVDDLKYEWEPTGIPWIDPLKEVTANIAKVGAGFATTPGICRSIGEDAYRLIDEQIKYLKYCKDASEKAGVTLPDTVLPVVPPDPVEPTKAA